MRKICLRTVLTVLALFFVSAGIAKAAPVTWGFNFYDETGAQVGSGRVVYDPATVDLLDYGSPSSLDDLEVTTRLDLVEFKFPGVNRTFDYTTHWWSEVYNSREVEGYVSYSRYGAFINLGELVFTDYDPFGALSYWFALDIATRSGNRATGNWFAYELGYRRYGYPGETEDAQGNPLPLIYFGEGNFNAWVVDPAQIPLPPAALLFLGGLPFLARTTWVRAKA